MNKKKIDEYIPKAVKELNGLVENGSIDKVYQGYFASFGPSVITSGLLQTVMFYVGDSNKKKIIDILYKLVKKDLNIQEESLDKFLVKNGNYKNYLIKNRILEANVACKLAIRTFNLKD